MTPEVIRELMNRVARNRIKTQWWGGWGSDGPTGGGTDDPTGGRGPGEGNPRGIGLFGDPSSSLYGTSGQGDFNPNALGSASLIQSEATPFLRATGLAKRNVNQDIIAALRGNFTYGVNPATGQAALREGALPWSTLNPDAVRALMDIQARAKIPGSSRRFVLTGDNANPRRKRTR